MGNRVKAIRHKLQQVRLDFKATFSLSQQLLNTQSKLTHKADKAEYEYESIYIRLEYGQA